jgi:hypothetical protein
MPEYTFNHLPKDFYGPLSQSGRAELPLELLAASKAEEIVSLIDDISTLKELFCVCAYAVAQHPTLQIEYLDTFKSLAEQRLERIRNLQRPPGLSSNESKPNTPRRRRP